MRIAVGVLLCLNVFAASLALADPADAPPAPTSAALAATAPPRASAPAVAAPATAVAAPAAATEAAAPPAPAPAIDPLEKHFLAEGYKIEMRHGEKMFCRREEVLGSRLGGQLVCSTAQQLKATEDQAHEALDRAQRQQTRGPSGN